MKLIYIDTETTGLDPVKNGLVQIAGIITGDGMLPVEFNLPLKPFSGDVIEQRAMEVNGITDLENRPTPEDAYMAFRGLLETHREGKEKFFFLGWNAPFDFGFLDQFFIKNGDFFFKTYFHSPPIDIMVLAAYHLIKDRPGMKNFKQATVAAHLGISVPNNLHDAMVDIRLTRAIWATIRKRKKEEQ